MDGLVENRGIARRNSVVDKSGRKDGTFERADFSYDAESDPYICPGGKEVKRFRRAYNVPRSGVDKDGIMRYRDRKANCESCGQKPRCSPIELIDSALPTFANLKTLRVRIANAATMFHAEHSMLVQR